MRAIVIVIIIIFLTVGVWMVFNSLSSGLKDFSDAQTFAGRTFNWLSTIGKNLWEITGLATSQEWLPDAGNQTNKSEEGKEGNGEKG